MGNLMKYKFTLIFIDLITNKYFATLLLTIDF